jgi:hypothetical protein
MHHIMIHVPAFGQIVSTATFLATHGLRDTLHQKGMATGISSISFPDIAELRGMVTTMWYDTMPHSDYLLWIDADMAFPPQHVVDMLLFDEPLVGTIYPQRRLPLTWAGSGDGNPFTQRKGDFIMVEGVGFGCTLMKREVIGRMMQHYPYLIDYRIKLHPSFDMLDSVGCKRIFRFFEKLDIPERGLISEDLAFCVRAGKIGIPTWAHVGSRIAHVGPFAFEGRYLDQIEKQMADQTAAEAAARQKVATSPVPVPMTLPANLLQAAE